MSRTDPCATPWHPHMTPVARRVRYPRPASQPRPSVDTRWLVIEYTYYVSVFYAIMGTALGLVVDSLGVGVLAVLAAASFFFLGDQVRTVSRLLFWPVSCAISYIVVQIGIHGESITGEYVRSFVPWLLTLVIVQSLARRPGFVVRAGLAIFVIGLSVLPYMKSYVPPGTIDRQGLDNSVTLANPNDLGAWFGFCAVYFVVLATESRSLSGRIGAWGASLVSLYVVALTVSRAPLFAVVVSIVVALRHLLKRGFIPLLLLCGLAWVLYASGIFATAVESYSGRAVEESGRLQVWPLALARLFDSPFVGVGVSNIETYVQESHRGYSPHNAFLFVALASGIVPTGCLIAYWYQALRGALRLATTRLIEAPFVFPLLLYTFVITMTLNLPFIAPWATISLVVTTNGRLLSPKSSVPFHVRRRLRFA